MDTKILETERLGQHPSFPGGMPAIIADPEPVRWCTDCAWLAGMIRAGRDAGDYAALAIEHWHARHNLSSGGPAPARHNLSGGAR